MLYVLIANSAQVINLTDYPERALTELICFPSIFCLGRSWVDPPKVTQSESESCFLPKRHIHTWSGHTKGVNAIHFFPQTGHLLLSAGLDGKAKIWDVVGDKQCMRTYMGHTKGIRDAWFFPDGRKFATASYDKTIKLWDTETGAVLG